MYVRVAAVTAVVTLAWAGVFLVFSAVVAVVLLVAAAIAALGLRRRLRLVAPRS
jgi:hypothetical protein